MRGWLALAAIALALAPCRVGADATITVDAGKTGPRLSPLQHGIFFEEINHAGDGGLYAEKLLNRTFADGLMGWAPVEESGGKAVLTVEPLDASGTTPARALHIAAAPSPGGLCGVRNGGYWGVGARRGETLVLTFDARTAGQAMAVRAAVTAPDGRVLARRDVQVTGATWRHYRCELRPSATEAKASLALTTGVSGDLWIARPTLFPKATFRGRPNGLRTDLAQMLAGMKPSFVRFPGGCFVEGNRLANRFHWPETIGDPTLRPGHHNLWGYRSTDGLGYHEYLQMCEDLGAEPLFVINCGMAHEDTVPMDQMGPYVQEALDAIEYANGDTTTPWGARRAANGHPAPFHLRLMEIGNENGGPAYEERYALFWDAIKKRYPDMTLVANVPVRSRPMDVVDEHYYASPGFFVQQSRRYDGYPRTGPRIYVGEYAVTQGCGTGNLIAALGEAFFITGMERNADVVTMASYAPLFVNTDNRAWNPDAIVFDPLRTFGTPSYWVQRMFSTNRGDTVLATEVQAPEQAPKVQAGGVGVGTWLTSAEFADLKVTRNGQVVWTGNSADHPLKPHSGTWKGEDGVLAQSSLEPDCWTVGGDPSWTDYTFTCRARKLSGAEGFLIMFRVRDERNWYWWNIGGWGNSRHNIEHATDGGKALVTRDVPGSIETGRWYDIRVEVAGDRVRCWLDGKLVHDAREAPTSPMAALATREDATGDLLLKVVNIGAEAQRTTVALSGVQTTGIGTATSLTSEKPTDENSFASPRKIVPVERPMKGFGSPLSYTFPPYSVTILRLKTR